MKRKTGFYLLIVLIFAVIVFIMFYLNRINRNDIKIGFEAITKAEGITIRELVKISGFHLVELGEKQLFKFFEDMFKNENIIYLGLMRGEDLIFLRSRYEGYFPIEETEDNFRFFKSPVGRIFEIKSVFLTPGKAEYKLYIGFNYDFLTTFEDTSKKNFLMIMAAILFVLLFLIIFIIRYDKKLYKQNLNFLREKEDKEHFKELSLLTSEIAHEIKNPLNSIYLSFSALEKYLVKDDKTAVFYKDAIKNEIKRISEIINSYSSVSKKIRPEYEKVDMEKFIKDFVLIKESELKELGIDMPVKNSVKCIFTDKKLLTQILLNLVNNAIEAKADKIEIDINKIKDYIEIIIRDNGDEIEENIRTKIFKPYISSKVKGMGLGLHITIKLLQAIDGNIELISWDKGNKEFKISLKERKNE